MSRIPSIGLVELFILAGIAGLVALIAVIVVAAIVKSRQKKGEPRPEGTRRSWIWIIIPILLVLIAILVIVGVLSVLLVTPVRQSTAVISMEPEVTVQSIVVTEPTVMPPSAVTTFDVTPTQVPLPIPTPEATSTGRSRVAPLSLNPQNNQTILVTLPVIAGLVLLVGAVIVAAVLKQWPASETQLKDSSVNGSSENNNAQATKLKYLFLVFVFWIALSIFLAFDLLASVSIYFKFTIVYAGFWALVGALFLHDRPLREKILILSLFLIVVFSIRFVDWNSRKPFLKDLYSIQEGMTPAQVEQIMGRYRIGGESPFLNGPETELNEQREIVTGGITYMHTDEGWGNSDWGVVIFEHGRVARVEFLPD